ncbi:hypothetical protein [Glycomyces halotolerans]
MSALSFPPHTDEPPRVDWTNADETNPIYPPESPSPDYDGDGTPDAEESDGPGTSDGGDGPSGPAPEGDGDAGEPEVDEPGRTDADGGDDGGLLGLPLAAQAGMSLGVIALAFLALLPGRRMPEHLR